MKYVAFYDCKDLKALVSKAIRRKYEKLREELKKVPDQFPKHLLLEDGSLASIRLSLAEGISMYEGTEEQMINLAAYWLPEVEIKFSLSIDTPTILNAFDLFKK